MCKMLWMFLQKINEQQKIKESEAREAILMFEKIHPQRSYSYLISLFLEKEHLKSHYHALFDIIFIEITFLLIPFFESFKSSSEEFSPAQFYVNYANVKHNDATLFEKVKIFFFFLVFFIY